MFIQQFASKFDRWRACEQHRDNTVDVKLASDNFKNKVFSKNCKFVNLPREKLFDSIIRNMQKRLMDSNHLLTRKSDEGSNLLHELIHLVEPYSWNIEEVTVPWMEAEEKLGRFQEMFSYKINVNDFRDYVEDVLLNGENHTMPPSIRKTS